MGKKMLMNNFVRPPGGTKRKKSKKKSSRRNKNGSVMSSTSTFPSPDTHMHNNSIPTMIGISASSSPSSSGLERFTTASTTTHHKKSKKKKSNNATTTTIMPRNTHDQMMISDEPFLPGGGGKKPITIDFLKDPISQMTYGRRIALSLMDKAWYYPRSKPPPRRQKHHDDDDDDDDDSHDEDEDDDDSNDSDSDSDSDDDTEGGKERIEVFEDEPDNIEDFSLPHSGRTMMVVPGVGGGSNLSKSDLMVMAGRHDKDKANNNNNNNNTPTPVSPPTRSMSVETRPPTVTRLERPSLAKAWAFFEHTTLPRYIVEEDYDGYGDRIRKQHELARAEPGENEEITKLYDPVRTHSSQLGDFGLGIGLYFSTLWGVVVLTFVAGLLNVPNILYFSSEEYSQGQPGVTFLLKGSAICTDTTWVPCPSCDPTKFESSRFATTTVDLSMLGMTSSMLTANNTDPPLSTNVTLQFALRNNCIGATIQEGFINYGTLVLIVLGLILISWRQKHHEIVFDEDEQTAQDYSVHIKNPPPDAFDPEEWRKFFRDRCNGAHATSVTIALDNDLLVRTLLERRECLRRIELLVEPGTALDALSLARLAAQIDKRRSKFARFKARFAGGVPELFSKIASLDARIEGLAQLDYQVSNVFCSFEYEEHQREVLHLLSVSDFNVSRQHSAGGITFRDRVLAVEEPQEPSTIIWQNLNERQTDLLKELITTSISAMVAIFLLAFLIQFLHRTQHPYVAAAAISICNSVFPQIAKMLTSFEKHSSESQKQTSLYFKINVFRWVNTAVVITIVTPFTRTLANGGLLSSVYAIFFAEIITSNAVQLADVMGHVHRHLLAPRSTTQDMMNLHMIGTDFELAERYTNMTKALFLALWYCAIYPGAFFMCSAALAVTYYVDRFSLMRTWRRKPMLGTTIAQFCRQYFFSGAVVAKAIVASYTWAGFPYDDLCGTGNIVSSTYIGSWTLQVKDNSVASTVIDQGDETYRYCVQELSQLQKGRFPATPHHQPIGSEWMTTDQSMLVEVYGWTSLAVMALVAWYFLFNIVKLVERYFRASYVPQGKDQEIPFSSVKSISTYVPQVPSPLYSYPLLACKTDGVDPDIFDWNDPDRPHSYYDLTRDALDLIGEERLRHHHVFSILSHSPPKADNRRRRQRLVL